MNTIAELLEQGRESLNAERERLRKAAEVSDIAKRAKFDREWAAATRFLKDAWPTLADCIEAPAFDPDKYLDTQLPRGTFDVDVRVPDLDWFEVRLERVEAGFQFDEPAIRLYTTFSDQSIYGGEEYLARDKRNPLTLESGSLAVALAIAQEYAHTRSELALEIEQKNANHAARVMANLTKQESAPTDAERALALVRELVDLVHVHRDVE